MSRSFILNLDFFLNFEFIFKSLIEEIKLKKVKTNVDMKESIVDFLFF
jgi:hypothetical protein